MFLFSWLSGTECETLWCIKTLQFDGEAWHFPRYIGHFLPKRHPTILFLPLESKAGGRAFARVYRCTKKWCQKRKRQTWVPRLKHVGLHRWMWLRM